MQDDNYYKQQFFAEARELLDSVSKDLLILESSPGSIEPLQAIFRNIHTIKGSAGVFDLVEVSAFAHHVENTLNRACEGQLTVSPELADVLFQGVDVLNALLDASQNGADKAQLEAIVPAVLVHQFENFGIISESVAQGADPGNGLSGSLQQGHTHISLANEVMPDAIRAMLCAHAASGDFLYRAHLLFNSEMLENGYDPLVLLMHLQGSSTVWAPCTRIDLPELSEFNPLHLYLDVTVYFASRQSAEELLEQAFDEELLSLVEIDPDGSFDDAVDSQALKDFLLESPGHVEEAETAALEYEKTYDPVVLDSIFRHVHTIKGDSLYVGLKSLGDFAHTLETLLDTLRRNAWTRSRQEAADAILRGIDTLKQCMQQLQAGNITLDLCFEGKKMSAVDSDDAAEPAPVVEDHVLAVFLNHLNQFRHVLDKLCGVEMPQDAEKSAMLERTLAGLRGAAAYVDLQDLLACVQQLQDAWDTKNSAAYRLARQNVLDWMDDVTGKSLRLGEILLQDGKVSRRDLCHALEMQKPLGEILVDTGVLDKTVLEGALKKQAIMRKAASQSEECTATPAAASTEIRAMRVDESKIDALSNIVGELVVAKNAYDYLIMQLASMPNLPSACLKNFKDNLYLFSRIVGNLQEGMLSVRMIPIRGVFQKYSRLVRDIARKQNKVIELVTEGDDTEIDKKVADTLSEPLIHMIRNACDHGIETPEERRACGKPEKGVVLLKAYQEGSRLYVKVIDDGKGIDRQKVYEKALIKGLSVTSPDDPGLLDIIFMSGFSTKDTITDVSGRGVGMDAVRSSVTALGGTVSLTSEHGKGSELTLELPMTMGISVALIVRAGDRQYALPLDSVLETIKVTPDKIHAVYDHKGIYYRGEVLPVESLDALLFQQESTLCAAYSADAAKRVYRYEDELAIVVLNTGRGKLGVVVDSFTRNVEIAIRPVPEALANVDVLSGVSILGDGKVLLVLNPENLL